MSEKAEYAKVTKSAPKTSPASAATPPVEKKAFRGEPSREEDVWDDLHQEVP